MKERDRLCRELEEDKETAMLAQYIREQGVKQGVHKGTALMLSKQMARKYNLPLDLLSIELKSLRQDALLELGEKILEWDSYEDARKW